MRADISRGVGAYDLQVTITFVWTIRSGLLYYYYHLVRREVRWLNSTLLNHEWVHHFVGLAKPWLSDANATSSNITQERGGHSSAEATRWWHQLRMQVLQDEVWQRCDGIERVAIAHLCVFMPTLLIQSLDADWVRRYRHTMGDRSLREQFIRRFYRNIRF